MYLATADCDLCPLKNTEGVMHEDRETPVLFLCLHCDPRNHAALKEAEAAKPLPEPLRELPPEEIASINARVDALFANWKVRPVETHPEMDYYI